MSQTIAPTAKIWTAEDLAERFGPIPLNRIRTDPPPGMGTVEDVVYLRDHEDRLYELVDGVLLEKVMGTYESYLGARILKHLANFVDERGLGIVLGADGMLELFPNRVRIPDVAFVSSSRNPFEAMQQKRVAQLVPDLVVEVISEANTPQEMTDKLNDYFRSGTRLVWHVYPAQRQVRVYTDPASYTTLDEQETLTGGDVLPDFELKLSELFARPKEGKK